MLNEKQKAARRLADSIRTTPGGTMEALSEKGSWQTVPKAAQEEIERLRAAPPAEEMAMLIRVLCRHVPAGKQIKANAVDFLRRHGLEGSTFRVAQLKDSEK